MPSSNDVNSLLQRLSGVYRDPTTVARESNNLLRSTVGRNLRPSVSILALNDGSYHPSVLMFGGTVSMTYRGREYHIPVDIYLPPGFPIRPPVCFVRPVSSMIIKENHRYVSADGMVYMPYLHSWRPQDHNLVEMTASMSGIFGTDPPVFAKRNSTTAAATPTQATVVTQQPPSYQKVDLQSQAEAIAIAESQQDELRRRERLRREEQENALALEQSRQEELARLQREQQRKDEERRSMEQERQLTDLARENLTKKIQSHLKEFYNEARDRITEDLKDQNTLSVSEKTIKKQVEDLTERKSELSRHCDEAKQQTNALATYIQTQSSEAPPEQIYVDDLATPADTHSIQMLNLAAENAAITDCLFFLDKAVTKGSIPLDVHLKKVRELSKRQFLVKAHLMKIAYVVEQEARSC